MSSESEYESDAEPQVEEPVAPPEEALFGGRKKARKAANAEAPEEPPARQRQIIKVGNAEIDMSLTAPTHLRGSKEPQVGAPYGFGKNGKPRKRPPREYTEEQKQKMKERLFSEEAQRKRRENLATTRARKKAAATAAVTGGTPPSPPPIRTRTVTKEVVRHVGPSAEEIEAMVATRLEKALETFEERRQARKLTRKQQEAEERKRAEAEAKRQEDEAAEHRRQAQAERRKRMLHVKTRRGLAPDF